LANAPPEPRGGATLRYRGRELWYRDAGAGEPVLLLHGIGAASHVWDPLIEAEPGYRFLAVDLPCTARSKDYCLARAEEISPALLALLDALHIPRAVVVGHSYGGVIAIDFVSRNPQRARGLVAISAPAVGVPPQLKQLLENPASEWAVKMFSKLPNFRSMVKSYLGFAWGDPSRLTDAQLDSYLFAMRADGFYPALLEGLRDVAKFRVPVAALKQNAVPAVAVWGDKDRLVPVVQGEQVATAIGAELVVLRGVGHAVPEEAPEAVAAAIERVVKAS
jgi:pyruvate dehydrogenase E2 component (dihydrolipoamide acetyltransferase)